MTTNEKKGITVRIDAELHKEVRQYLESHEMTMVEFVTLALQDELRPKLNMTEVKSMGNMRTLAFQVPEELFQQIKDYLLRNNITQKEFVIGLIETEIERDLTQRAAINEAHTESEEMAEEQTEAQETAPVNDCKSVSREAEEEYRDQENDDLSENFEAEDEDLGEDQNETEEMGMLMGM